MNARKAAFDSRSWLICVDYVQIMRRHPLMLQRSYGDLCGIMPQTAYFREQAERYFRIARAKSDRKMAARLEATAREFLAKAEAASTGSQPEAGHVAGWSAPGPMTQEPRA